MALRLAIASISTVLISAVSAAAPPPAQKPAIPTTEQTCVAAGGDWSSIGLPGMPKRCDLKATDAGVSCTDSIQCQGSCLARSDAAIGSVSSGSCSTYVSNFGELRVVRKGKVELLHAE